MDVLQGQKNLLIQLSLREEFQLKSQIDVNIYCRNSFLYLMTIKQTPVTPMNVTAGRSDSFRSIVYMFQGICIANLNVSSHGQIYSSGGKGGGKVCKMRTQQETEMISRSCSGRGESSRVIPLRLPRD